MSLRHYHATAIDCDGCGECYSDTCEVRDDLLFKFAQRDGWTGTDDGRDYCPACSRQRWTVATTAEQVA